MKSYSLDYIDALYVQYVRDPASVSENWRKYFEQFLVFMVNVSEPEVTFQTPFEIGTIHLGRVHSC